MPMGQIQQEGDLLSQHTRPKSTCGSLTLWPVLGSLPLSLAPSRLPWCLGHFPIIQSNKSFGEASAFLHEPKRCLSREMSMLRLRQLNETKPPNNFI